MRDTEDIARRSKRLAHLLVRYEQRFRRQCCDLADEIVSTILARYPDAVERHLIFDVDTNTTGIEVIRWSFWVDSIILPGYATYNSVLVTFVPGESIGWLEPVRRVVFVDFDKPFDIGTGIAWKKYDPADVDECWNMVLYFGQNLGDVLAKPRGIESPKREE